MKIEVIATHGPTVSILVNQAVRDTLDEARISTSMAGPQRVGDGEILTFAPDAMIEPYSGFFGGHTLCTMGAFSYVGQAPLPDIKIGRYCSIASGLTVPGPRHRYDTVTSSSINYDAALLNIYRTALEDEGATFSRVDNPQKPAPVIGHDVWIGERVSLMPGITIGHGSVIAAASVVTKDVPPMEIWGGNPARKIKDRFPEEQARGLLESRWWEMRVGSFASLPSHDVDAFLEAIGDRRGGPGYEARSLGEIFGV